MHEKNESINKDRETIKKDCTEILDLKNTITEKFAREVQKQNQTIRRKNSANYDYFKSKLVIRENKGYYIIVKGSINQEDMTIINIYAPNFRTSKYRSKH